MLYILRQSDVNSAKAHNRSGCHTEPRDYVWHVGQSRPCLVGDRPFDDVCEIQADGHELEYIRREFKNLPDARCAVVQWKGEMAQFIYDHLR